jgi:hypothetical protein
VRYWCWRKPTRVAQVLRIVYMITFSLIFGRVFLQIQIRRVTYMAFAVLKICVEVRSILVHYKIHQTSAHIEYNLEAGAPVLLLVYITFRIPQLGSMRNAPPPILPLHIIAARGQFTAWLSNSSVNTLPSEKHKSHDNRQHASSWCNNLSFS